MTVSMSTDLDRQPAPIDPSAGVVVHVAGDLYLSFDHAPAITQSLQRVETVLEVLRQQGVSLMTVASNIQDLIAAMNTATNAIAARIAALIAQISGGLSASEAESVNAELTTLKTQLEGLGANPDNPVPEPPPPTARKHT